MLACNCANPDCMANGCIRARVPIQNPVFPMVEIERFDDFREFGFVHGLKINGLTPQQVKFLADFYWAQTGKDPKKIGVSE